MDRVEVFHAGRMNDAGEVKQHPSVCTAAERRERRRVRDIADDFLDAQARRRRHMLARQHETARPQLAVRRLRGGEPAQQIGAQPARGSGDQDRLGQGRHSDDCTDTTVQRCRRASVASPKFVVAPRAPRRPPRKARGGSIPGVCDRRATPRGGMHRRPNANELRRHDTSATSRG